MKPPSRMENPHRPMRFLSLFILVPVLELIVLIRMGQWIGLWPTLGLVVVTGVAGAALVRREGVRVLADVRQELASGRVPTRSLLDAGALLVGGAFLLTPGVLTDIAGFSLLVPPVRTVLFRSLRRRLERSIEEGALRVQMGGFRWAGSPGPGSRETGSREAGFPGQSSTGPGSPAPGVPGAGTGPGGMGPGDEGVERGGRPPRPGEIIQE